MKKAKILIVDDELDTLNGLEQSLTAEGFIIRTVDCGKKVLSEVKKFSPDLILMDVMLGDSNGYELKEQLNKNIYTAVIPVIFISVHRSLDYKRHSFKTGGVDHIAKPVDMEELIIRIDSILTRKKFYENMYMRDTLTGLYNRSHFEKQARILYSLARKYSKPFSMAVIDIDGLKNVNSCHGHQAGDFIIKKTAEVIKETIRNMDIATRYGGDEFIVLLPETDNDQARAFLNRLNKAIKSKELKYKDNKNISFSISAGSATCTAGEIDLEKMFSMADLNMYVEKTRNERPDTKNVLVIEDEVDIARGVKLELEAEGFSVKDIIYKFDDAVEYIKKSRSEPSFVILDLDLGGRLSPDFLGIMYSKWRNTRVYIFTAYMEYMDLYPYFKDIVSGVFTKSELPELISSLKKDIKGGR